jgi:hypothetical protein
MISIKIVHDKVRSIIHLEIASYYTSMLRNLPFLLLYKILCSRIKIVIILPSLLCESHVSKEYYALGCNAV